MKTGKLLKFHRPGGDVQAYVYLEGGLFRAALYLLTPARSSHSSAVHAISGPSEAVVEEAVRAWVDENFPRSPPAGKDASASVKRTRPPR